MTTLCATAARIVAASEAAKPSRERFERIYDERYADVERWIRALGGRSADIPDLAQEVFIIALQNIAHFDGQNVGGWLYQITRRKMRDYRRLSWVKHLFNSATVSTCEWSPALAANQLEQLEHRERTALMGRILNTLPAEQRAAFVLFDLQGVGGAEIAQLQQVPINTVWARIRRARRKLHARVGAADERPSPPTRRFIARVPRHSARKARNCRCLCDAALNPKLKLCLPQIGQRP